MRLSAPPLLFKNQNTRGKVITYTSNGEPMSYHYDNKWDFVGVQKVGKNKYPAVSFKNTNPEFKRGIQDTLYILYKFYRDKESIAPTYNQLKNWKLGLETISHLIGSTCWKVLNNKEEFLQFKSKLKLMKIGKGAMEGKVVVVLNRLFDTGLINIKVNGRELVALSSSRPVKQHIAIPIKMYQSLLEHCIRTIEIYYPYRHEISNVMEQAYINQEMVKNGDYVKNNEPSMTADAIGFRVRKLNDDIKCRIPNFNIDMQGIQLGKIQSACLVVVIAFSGVRIGEALEFSSKRYVEKEVKSGNKIPTLQGATTKGNGGTPKRETWQSHPIAKDALELAECMTMFLRKRYKEKVRLQFNSGSINQDEYNKALNEIESAFIPLKIGIQKNRYIASGSDRKLNKLMRNLGIKATEEDVNDFNLLNPTRESELKTKGNLPKFSAHDLRRTFAVFFKRYGFGTATGIKFQYKHHNIQMSDYYACNADLAQMHDVLMDVELIKMMEEEGVRLGVDIYDEIYNQSIHLSGVEGERIAENKVSKLKAGFDVYMDKSEIERLVRNGDIAVVQLPSGGYCTNSDCERVCGTGLFIGEKNKCANSVQTDKTAKQQAQLRKRLISQFKGLNNGDYLRKSILVGLKQKIKDIEITLDKHEIKHKKFKDRIKRIVT